MARFLLDTNVLSEPLRPQPNPTLMERLIDQIEELSTASVVYHEMLFSYRRLPELRRRQAIAAYLQEEVETKLVILLYDAEAANRNSLTLAAQHSVQSIAFLSISTGVYGFPLDRATHIALQEVTQFLADNASPQLVKFVCFGEATYQRYLEVIQHLEIK